MFINHLSIKSTRSKTVYYYAKFKERTFKFQFVLVHRAYEKIFLNIYETRKLLLLNYTLYFSYNIIYIGTYYRQYGYFKSLKIHKCIVSVQYFLKYIKKVGIQI